MSTTEGPRHYLQRNKVMVISTGIKYNFNLSVINSKAYNKNIYLATQKIKN
jgi:hypothetical protein